MFFTGAIVGLIAVPFMIWSLYSKQAEETYAVAVEPVPVKETGGNGTGSDGGADNS